MAVRVAVEIQSRPQLVMDLPVRRWRVEVQTPPVVKWAGSSNSEQVAAHGRVSRRVQPMADWSAVARESHVHCVNITLTARTAAAGILSGNLAEGFVTPPNPPLLSGV